MRRAATLLGCCLPLIALSPALAQDGTLDAPVGQFMPYALDTGALANPGAERQVVFMDWVEVPGAAWVRLYFSEVDLAPGSTLRVTSMLDGEVQELDDAGLEMWSNTTAYFNGELLQVELIAAPGTHGNRVVVDHVGVEFPHVGRGGAGECGICGLDDRVPSNEDWAARLLPAGCTAEVYSTRSCSLTAGHCIGGSMVMQFRVPPSNPNCTIVNPPVADQFPVTAVQFSNNGVGSDWAIMSVGTNGNGERPFDRYGRLRRLSSVLANVGATASITGYGLDHTCTRSQTQQFVSGPVVGRTGTIYDMEVDVRGGNSGSALIYNNVMIGVVTHCRFGCPNIATRIDLPAFVAARELLCPDCIGDMNGDGTLDVADFTVFRARFLAGDPEADVDGNGLLDVADFTRFRAAFLGGCP